MERRARSRTTTALLLLLVAGLTGFGSVPAALGQPAGLGALLADEHGDPIAGREVAVYAEVDDLDTDGGEIIRLDFLGTLTTDAQGVLVDDAGLGQQAVLLAPERPSLMLFSNGPEGVAVQHVELDADGVPLQSDDGVDDHAGTGPPGKKPKRIELHAAPTGADFSIMSHTNPCGSTGGPYLKATSSYTKRWAPFQRTQTLGKTKAKYTWETTSKTKLEIAAAGNWGAHAGGLVSSKSNTSTGGFSSTLPTSTSRRIDAEWNWRRYDVWCTPLSGTSYYSGSWEWRPDHWTAGNRNSDGQSSLSCKSGTRTRIDNTTWVAQTTSTTFGGYYSIAGVNLRSQQTNSSSHKLTFIPQTAPAYICGTTDVPTKSKQVRETT